MTFAEFNTMEYTIQKQWADSHPIELGDMVFDECGKQYNNTRSVLPPQCCSIRVQSEEAKVL